MNISELRDFLIKNVPNFEEPEILHKEGICYHYTPHCDKIQKFGRFKGARIDENLDQTQRIKYLVEATENEGVVFAYEKLKDAQEEGFGLKIIRIRYKKAIRSLHKAEDDFGNSSREIENENEKSVTPKTLLILTSDILAFEFVR
nr:hypothetical protein [Bacteroidota bacterium]